MNPLQDLIKSIQKKNEKIHGSFGLNSLQGLTNAIAKQNDIQYKLSGLSALQYPKHNTALLGLTSTLSEIAKKNQKLSDKLSGFASSQMLVTNNFSAIATALSQTHLSQFNSLNIALRGISQAYLKGITTSHSWDDISIAEEANDTIAKATDGLLFENSKVTIQDLDNLKQSIVGELYCLLEKTKTGKARQFLSELITIIGFLLTLYGFYNQQSDASNNDVIDQTRIEIERINQELSKKIETELQKLTQTRLARTNVNLRYADKKTSKIIGLVKTGQRVTVIEKRHKFILISYIDLETGEPKSGFVVKKYFEKEK